MVKLPSFAQGQEDLIVMYLLDYKQSGFYVDVGCFHPKNLSNTWLLYNNNWQGLCIDPNPNLDELYHKFRPRDTFIPCAVAKEETTSTFHVGNHLVHSSLIESENSSTTKIDVTVKPLQKLLVDNNAPEIDFLTIDAEGAEIEILESFNWETYRPKLVLVEYNSADVINLDLQRAMIARNYLLLFINNWNFLFCEASNFSTFSLKLHGFQREGSLFPPIAAKIHPTLKNEKTLTEWKERGYEPEPVVTFIIQSHNKSDQVIHLVSKLEQLTKSEIIVIDDGSELFHTEQLAERLTRGNQMLLRTNDLYETITYDRAISLARGQLVVLLQDDDDFDGYGWIQQAVTLFSEIPDLAIMGGRNPIELLPFEPEGDGTTIGSYTVEGCIAHTPNLLRQNLCPKPEFPSTFQFATTVNRAPMWIHRGHFITTLGSIDQSYAPFQADDYELCLRCWRSGLKVGWYPAGFQIQGIGTGGMRIWNNQLTREQSIKNMKKVYQTYGDQLSEINQKVREANRNYWSLKR